MVLKERMERFAMLPFSVGCASQSSVAVIESQPKKILNELDGGGRGEKSQDSVRTKSSLFPQHPRPNFSAKLHKVANRFKSLSNLFSIYKNDDEERKVEMEIGYPTDLKHVGHIAWDGFNNVCSSMKNWERTPEFFPMSSLSLKQFELAMASQAEGSGPLRGLN